MSSNSPHSVKYDFFLKRVSYDKSNIKKWVKKSILKTNTSGNIADHPMEKRLVVREMRVSSSRRLS